MTREKLIPITIISGFLGSGKTTLLNKILKKNNSYKIAVVVNEFGDVKLETQLIKSQGEGIIELQNGCVCCVARGDMITTLESIMISYPDTEYIIIEASGLSDPFSLSLTFYNPSVRDRFRLDSIVCIVDYLNFDQELDAYDIARKQISDANFIVISKFDEKNALNLKRLTELLVSLNSKAQIYIDNERFDPLILLDRSVTDLKSLKDLEFEESHEHKHEDFEHFIFKTDKEVDYEKFEEFIMNLDKNVIRTKGFVNFRNAPHKNKKYLLQYVLGRKDYRIEDWSKDKKWTVILFIGKNMDRDKLEENLEKLLKS